MRSFTLLVLCLSGCPETRNPSDPLPDLAQYTYPDLSEPPDLSAAPANDLASSSPDLQEVVGTPRAVIYLYVDVVPSPSPTPVPAGANLIAQFYPPVLSAAEATSVETFASDPQRLGTIADDTCTTYPLPGNTTVKPISIGKQLEMRSNGAVILTASPPPSPQPVNYVGYNPTAPWTGSYLNPGIDIFVINQLGIGAEVLLAHTSVADLPSELKQPINASRTAAQTFNWSAAGADPSDRLFVTLPNGHICGTSFSKGTLTVPQSEMALLTAGPAHFDIQLVNVHHYPLWPSHIGFITSTPGPSPSPLPSPSPAPYLQGQTAPVFRFLSVTIGGVVN
jgi:hypothetical protein